jgi:hypothetical protein
VRVVRALLATLTLLAVATLPMLAAPSSAAAQEPEALVSIRLDSFSPSLPKRTSTITVTGEVTNTSKKRLLRPRAYFWRNQAPITDNEGFDQALASVSNDPIGARKITSFANLYDQDEPYLEPGDSEDFNLKVKVADLELSPTNGIYLMGVHVLQNEQPVAVGRARVFVPVLTRAPRNTQRMTTIVALNTRPSLVSKGLFSDDHLADEIAPGGRLSVLLDAADRSDVSFAVDPALIEELEQMKSGYRVLDDDSGDTEDGVGKADAQRWLDGFARLVTTRDGYRLLYGSPDAAALTHAGRQDVLDAAEAAAKTVSSTAALPLLVWPANGLADSMTLTSVQALNPAAILLSESSTQSTAPLLQGLEGVDDSGAAIVNYTAAAFGGGPGPAPSDTAVHLQQRLVSESWLQATREPSGSTLGRVRVISNRAQAESDDESVKASWIQQTTLTQLLASKPVVWPQFLHYSERDRSRELTPGQLGALSKLTVSWATWQDLLVDQTEAKASAQAALARDSSVRMRGAWTPFKAVVSAQQNALTAQLNAVQISATHQVVTPKAQVKFPITIRNTLPPSSDPDNTTTNQVKVQLRFSSANSQRLTVEPIPLNTIDAGQNLQAEAAVDARTNGTVRVTAQLYTASGRPVGRPATIDVKATQAGTVGWFIAIGAGIVLVGTTALRIRQVTRARARAASLTPPPMDATRSAPPEDITRPESDELTLANQDPRAPGTAADPNGQNTAESIDV